MTVAHENLPGLDRDRVLAVVGPVLLAHQVEGVELIWRTDREGRVLQLTVERPDSRAPGEGITVALCSEISRDLSTALDVAEVIPSNRYRLEVGSPGLERALYSLRDYERFAGQLAKLKLEQPIDSQWVIQGRLQGVDEQSKVLIETTRGGLSLGLEEIESGRLIFEWGTSTKSSARGRRAPRRAQRSR